MGKGDIRTKRGKIIRGTYGNVRPRPKKKTYVSTSGSNPQESKKPQEGEE